MLPYVKNKKGKGKKRGPGQPKGGVRDFIRELLHRAPGMRTTQLRDAAFRRFGWTANIDRHFPQLVYQLKKELGCSPPKATGKEPAGT